jgi:predicted TIM-barrel fold metal-dependent hydrolase
MSVGEQPVFNGGKTEVRTLAESRRWSRQHEEPVLEPELPFVDAHHHFFDRPDGRYELDELFEDIAGQNVLATVFVECESKYRALGSDRLRPVGETEYVVGLATDKRTQSSTCRVAAGIIGFADLMLGHAVDEVLAEHVAAARGRFRGIRYRVMWDPHGTGMFAKGPPRYRAGIMMDPQFRAGFSRLARFGLVFDTWQYFFQLSELYDLARAFPETTIVVDHVGGTIRVGPYARPNGHLEQTWLDSMRALASLPNVYLKVGGLGMTMYGFGFHEQPIAPNSQQLAKVWRPYFETSVELFGPRRCMLQSNFPADQQSCSYRAIWNAFKLLTKNYSLSERNSLFSDTANKVFRLTGEQK